jgi:hypothetical protein
MTDPTPTELAKRVLELDKAGVLPEWDDNDPAWGPGTISAVIGQVRIAQHVNKHNAELIVFLRNNAVTLATALLEAEDNCAANDALIDRLQHHARESYAELAEAQKHIRELEAERVVVDRIRGAQ